MVGIKLGVAIVCVCVLVVVVIWLLRTLSLDADNCRSVDAAYPLSAQISSFPIDGDAGAPYREGGVGVGRGLLRDYYVASAYDACSPGTYKNDFVNVCVLKRIIAQGVRCLDFAVYTVDDEPVIATSDVKAYTVKGSYNSVPFGEAMGVIRDHAFSAGACPCYSDPLLIHLRLKTRVAETFGKIARALQEAFGSLLLGPQYSYQSHYKNFGKTNLISLRGKVVIIIDQSNTSFLGTELAEYANMASNAHFMRLLRYTDGVLQCGDPGELLTYNKKCMTIVLPDRSVTARNYPVFQAQELGCQLCALAYQTKDANVVYDLDWFSNVGHSFVLKPEAQRWIPYVSPARAPLPEGQDYTKRTIHLPIGPPVAV